MNCRGRVYVNTTVLVPNETNRMSIIGWGIDSEGAIFWNICNFWESYWGEKGYFRIIRGVNSHNIESDCGWEVPKDACTNDVRNKTTSFLVELFKVKRMN
jgi:cathepsin X